MLLYFIIYLLVSIQANMLLMLEYYLNAQCYYYCHCKMKFRPKEGRRKVNLSGENLYDPILFLLTLFLPDARLLVFMLLFYCGDWLRNPEQDKNNCTPLSLHTQHMNRSEGFCLMDWYCILVCSLSPSKCVLPLMLFIK